MTMTDPIADMLTRIRNATTAGHDETVMPYSKQKAAIADILLREGYVEKWEQVPGEPVAALNVILKYGPNREKTIRGIKRISKPGLRVYARRDSLPRVLGGLGIAIISTSHGLMTDKQAAKQRTGGEVLCYVW